MARTKADAGKKAGGKAPRKAPVLRTGQSPKVGASTSKTKSRSRGSKNTYCKRPIPDWQVPIGQFLSKAGSSKEDPSKSPDEVTLLDDSMECSGSDVPSPNVDAGETAANGNESDETSDEKEDILADEKNENGKSPKDQDNSDDGEILEGGNVISESKDLETMYDEDTLEDCEDNGTVLDESLDNLSEIPETEPNELGAKVLNEDTE